jgi:hypothetical protein
VRWCASWPKRYSALRRRGMRAWFFETWNEPTSSAGSTATPRSRLLRRLLRGTRTRTPRSVRRAGHPLARPRPSGAARALRHQPELVPQEQGVRSTSFRCTKGVLASKEDLTPSMDRIRDRTRSSPYIRAHHPRLAACPSPTTNAIPGRLGGLRWHARPYFAAGLPAST